MKMTTDQIRTCQESIHLLDTDIISMDEVVNRLLESKKSAIEETTKTGYFYGMRWAMMFASFAQLNNINNVVEQVKKCGLSISDYFTEEEVYSHSVVSYGKFHVVSALGYVLEGDEYYDEDEFYEHFNKCTKDFWKGVLGDNVSLADNSNFVDGFVSGVIDLFSEVQVRLSILNRQ
jgi:hypothetical protein